MAIKRDVASVLIGVNGPAVNPVVLRDTEPALVDSTKLVALAVRATDELLIAVSAPSTSISPP